MTHISYNFYIYLAFVFSLVFWAQKALSRSGKIQTTSDPASALPVETIQPVQA